MTINYICKGFDKKLYNFDAVVVPVSVSYINKSEKEVSGFKINLLKDFRNDLNEMIQGLQASAFESNVLTAVKSEKTGIYYIFIMVHSCDHMARSMGSKNWEIYRHKHYINCCEKMVECIKNLDVKNVLIHPLFNKADFIIYTESDFLAKTLESNIDRFAKKNIYIFVEDLTIIDNKIASAFYRMKRGVITPDECKQIYVESKMENSMSYTNRLIRIAETETKYKEKSIMEQFHEDMKNASWFFDEYINKYQGTASDLAKNADIDNSTISTIKNHKYKEKSKTVVIALAIALDLTIDDRKRFINSAGFSYPINEHDRFIEQQLRKKRYTSVIDFNEDIMDEYPKFIVKTRSFRKCKDKKSDK